MRIRTVALAILAVLTACSDASPSEPVVGDKPILTETEEAAFRFSVEPVRLPGTPAPLVRVEAGRVTAVIPDEWDARPLPEGRYPQEGFVASPRIPAWERGIPTVQGMEAFWIDGGRLRIPSDYYYLVARAPSLGSFANRRGCEPGQHEVVADHPPDVTGRTTSPGDFVAQGSGICRKGRWTTRWAYAVVAPGFGPVREIGIPNSGLYVVVAVISGERAGLLDEMIQGATFGSAKVSDLVRVAGAIR